MLANPVAAKKKIGLMFDPYPNQPDTGNGKPLLTLSQVHNPAQNNKRNGLLISIEKQMA
jgi:hypothetical protein